NSNRSLGPVAAVGIAAALLVMLTYLPAVLALLGRAAFWPFTPRDGERKAGGRRGFWSRLAAMVGRRARPVWVVTALALVASAALMTQLRADGVAQSDFFLADVDSVAGQEALARHFPAGAASPTVIITKADQAEAVTAAASGVEGVARVQPAGQVDDLAQVLVVLAAPADSDEAIETVRRLRDAVHAVPGADALVGGPTAVDLDTREAASRD